MNLAIISQNKSLMQKQISANVQTAEQFLSICDKFKLGCLLTEQQNPKTINLSTMAQNDIPKAIDAIKQLDIHTIEVLSSKIPEIEALYRQINDTLESGGRIFICGCGATGRLSLVLQALWRHQTDEIFNNYKPQGKQYEDWKDRVIAFMAGGDAALIKSIEDFQDHPEFAHQQVIQLGFKENDLMIGSTEGGQTPWVIGAVWKSTELTKRKPFILYGNTDEILIQNVQRSKQFIESDKINKINCNVDQMALAGSTRMQSTTILMYAIGLALLGCDWIRKTKLQKQTHWREYAQNNVKTFLDYIKSHDFSGLAPIIEYQSQLYKEGQQITYHTDYYYVMSILTDTTQRSPTFSLNPFPNRFDANPKKCWCNLKLNHKGQNQELELQEQVKNDWNTMLGNRGIRGLDSPFWDNYKSKVSSKAILGFTLHTSHAHGLHIEYPFNIKVTEQHGKQVGIAFQLQQFRQEPCRLSQHILAKILLNNLSTVIMGRMNRYQSNIMTYVRPTNYKLIDRATRYVRLLLKEENWEVSYEDVVKVIYDLKQQVKQDEPIVIRVIDYIKKNNIRSNQK